MMSVEDLQKFAQLSPLWQRKSSYNTDASWAKITQNTGEMGQNTQAKVMLQTKSPLFGLQRSHTSPLSTPPVRAPIFAPCAPLWRCTFCQDNNPTQQRCANDQGGKIKVFFPPQPTVFQIFRAITFYTLYNIVILFYHLFLFLNSFQTAYNFKSTSFSFFCWFLFFPSVVFLWTTSFTFFSLSVFVSVS